MATQPRELRVSPEAWDEMKKRSGAVRHAWFTDAGAAGWDTDAALRDALLVIFPGGVTISGEEEKGNEVA